MTRRTCLAVLAGWPAGLARARTAAPVRSGQDDPTAFTIAELAAAYADGRISPLEVTAAYLARIDAEDRSLGAYVTVARDRAVDDTRRLLVGGRGTAGDRRPLYGVPVAHKDLLQTRGVRTTGGSRLYEHDIPDADADLVARLAGAGAVMLGKTNTHELGGGVTTINPFFGTTRNPRDRSRIPGGSSGGSAAAVAARLTLVATGSDTGGSVRIPAALCGCVGLKPTFRRLPTTGVLGACPTFDHVGLLTRTAEDAALVFAAVAPAAAAPAGSDFLRAYRAAVTRGAGALRIGVPRAYFFDALEPGVAAAVESAIDALGRGGAEIVPVDAGVAPDTYPTLFDPIAVSEIRATYASAWRSRPDAFSSEFAAVFTAPRIDDRTLALALAAREAFEHRIRTLFTLVDVLAMPTVPLVAPPIDGPIDGMRILRNTWAWNAARVPAVSVPCGTGADGLPVGLQLVGAADDEATLLAAATLVERATPR